MKLGLKDIDWKYIAAILAQGDDNDQVEFFKSFVKECNTWETEYQIETQLTKVNQKLTPKEKYVLGMLSYIEEKI